MTLDELLDDSARPKAPPVPGLTPQQRAQGRHLAAIHQMHLRDVDMIGQIMQAIADGLADPASLAPALAALPMTQNMARFGTICGQECRVLTGHHDIEEYSIFPALSAQADPALQAVLDRLIAEHKLIHQLIEDLAQTAAALARDPSEPNFARVSQAYRPLAQAVRSHFGYEETQLEAALGASGIPI